MSGLRFVSASPAIGAGGGFRQVIPVAGVSPLWASGKNAGAVISTRFAQFAGFISALPGAYCTDSKSEIRRIDSHYR